MGSRGEYTPNIIVPPNFFVQIADLRVMPCYGHGGKDTNFPWNGQRKTRKSEDLDETSVSAYRSIDDRLMNYSSHFDECFITL
jgi:hypothetical protein